MHEAQERVAKLADFLDETAEESDALGRLTDETVTKIKETGIVRMLQPEEFGGYEAHPREFLESVMEMASQYASAGWVAGVVGIHPFELAQADPSLQAEIWGENPDTWTASPYAPLGKARRVDGGYLFSGRWPFSSGTDHCEWIILGGQVTQDDRSSFTPPDFRHFVLPRADYEIVNDSWEVIGLKGTGSKDIVINDAFIPEYRVISQSKMESGEYARLNRPGKDLYRLPMHLMFPAAICSATAGIAEGALIRFAQHTENRVQMSGAKATADSFQMAALGAAAADIQSTRLQILSDITRLYEIVQTGAEVTPAMQAEARRNQVRATRRSNLAVQSLFQHAGGSAARLSNPLQRFFRDLNTGMGHACNADEPVYAAWSLRYFGQEVPAGVII